MTSELSKPIKITSLISILLMLVLIPIQIFIYSMFTPETETLKIIELLHENAILGLISLDLFYVINSVLLIVIYTTMFFITKKENNQLAILAFVLGLVGLASYFPTNPMIEMYNFSVAYFSSGSNQSSILSSAEAVMSSYSGTAFVVYYILNGLSLLLFSFIM